jgi:hypothetical protein
MHHSSAQKFASGLRHVTEFRFVLSCKVASLFGTDSSKSWTDVFYQARLLLGVGSHLCLRDRIADCQPWNITVAAGFLEHVRLGVGRHQRRH